MAGTYPLKSDFLKKTPSTEKKKINKKRNDVIMLPW